MRQGNGTKLIGIALVIVLVGMGLAFLAAAVDEFGKRGMEFAVLAILGEAALFSFLFFGPVGRAIAGLLEGEPGADPMYDHRLADVEDRLSEISGEVQRLSELEARLEFTERLLTKPTADYPREGGP